MKGTELMQQILQSVMDRPDLLIAAVIGLVTILLMLVGLQVQRHERLIAQRMDEREANRARLDLEREIQRARDELAGHATDAWFEGGVRQPPDALVRAHRAIQNARILSQDNVDAGFLEGAYMHAVGHPEAALAHYDSALEQRPSDAQIHAFKALVLLDLGRCGEATAEARIAVDLQPSTAWSRAVYADALRWKAMRTNRPDGFRIAAEEARKAVAADRSFARAHVVLGLCLLHLGEQAAGVSALTDALAIDPTHARARNALALLRRRTGDFQGALGAFTDVLSQPMSDAQRSYLLLHRAQTWLALREPNWEAALGDASQAWSLLPKGPEQAFVLSLALRARELDPERVGKLRRARAVLQRQLRRTPQIGRLHRELGWVEGLLGNESGGRALLEEALRVNPNDDVAAYWLGDRLEALGDDRGALRLYELAVSLGGKNGGLQQALTRVRTRLERFGT